MLFSLALREQKAIPANPGMQRLCLNAALCNICHLHSEQWLKGVNEFTLITPFPRSLLS